MHFTIIYCLCFQTGQAAPASTENKPFAFTGAPTAAAAPAQSGFNFAASSTPSFNFTAGSNQQNAPGSTSPFQFAAGPGGGGGNNPFSATAPATAASIARRPMKKANRKFKKTT